MDITRTFDTDHYKITVTIHAKDTPTHARMTDYQDRLRQYAGAVARDLHDRMEKLLR